jgi:hypothetical protein
MLVVEITPGEELLIRDIKYKLCLTSDGSWITVAVLHQVLLRT